MHDAEGACAAKANIGTSGLGGITVDSFFDITYEISFEPLLETTRSMNKSGTLRYSD